MAKVIIKEEEVINLQKMIISQDDDNKNLAFLSIENCDIKKSANALLILYKFVNVTAVEWRKNCPKMISHLEKVNLLTPLGGSSHEVPSMPAVFHKLIANKASKEDMLLFLKFHNNYLMNTMEAWGYPVDKFEIITKLKDYAD